MAAGEGRAVLATAPGAGAAKLGAAPHLSWELGEEGNIHLLALGGQTFEEGLAGLLGVIHSWLVALQEQKGPELIPLWHQQQPEEWDPGAHRYRGAQRPTPSRGPCGCQCKTHKHLQVPGADQPITAVVPWPADHQHSGLARCEGAGWVGLMGSKRHRFMMGSGPMP